MLAQRLAAAQATVEALTYELSETNQGVLVLHAELEIQAEQLRQAMDLKGRFLAYMSHEFRTPLGSMRSIARLLLDRMDGPLTDEQQVQVEFIQKSAIELNDMVDDVLDLAKLDAGRVTISPAWFELVDLFSALRGMFRPILMSVHVDLYFDDPVDVPKIYTDDRKLSQILRNFISNAIKFTPSGEVRVSAICKGDFVTFSVRDTGIGIAADQQAGLFTEFTQVDGPLQRGFRGTGLGLAVCRRFAELLHGSVAMHSVVDVGSTFSVTIPVRLPE